MEGNPGLPFNLRPSGPARLPQAGLRALATSPGAWGSDLKEGPLQDKGQCNSGILNTCDQPVWSLLKPGPT